MVRSPAPRILLLGDLMLDVACVAEDLMADEEVEGELALAPGGQPFVVAAWLAKYGCAPTVIGALSTRAPGSLFLTLAGEYGVQVEGKRYDLEQGIVLLIRHADGRASKIAHAGVTRLLDQDALRDIRVDLADAVYVSGYAFGRPTSRETALQLCKLARSFQVPLFLDLGSRLVSKDLTAEDWRQLLHEAEPTVVFATAGEVEAIMKDEQQLAGAARAVVIKRGKDGVALISGTDHSEHPAVQVDVLDASGCGDALAAAFISAWLRGDDPAASARAGLASAAQCAATRGALPELGPPTATAG